jgi:hypothetical protein
MKVVKLELARPERSCGALFIRKCKDCAASTRAKMARPDSYMSEKACMNRIVEVARDYIRSLKPGSLTGLELSLAIELCELDGEIWEPWCVSSAEPADGPID